MLERSCWSLSYNLGAKSFKLKKFKKQHISNRKTSAVQNYLNFERWKNTRRAKANI